jgi:hypothetical protein
MANRHPMASMSARNMNKAENRRKAEEKSKTCYTTYPPPATSPPPPITCVSPPCSISPRLFPFSLRKISNMPHFSCFYSVLPLCAPNYPFCHTFFWARCASKIYRLIIYKSCRAPPNLPVVSPFTPSCHTSTPNHQPPAINHQPSTTNRHGNRAYHGH